MTFTPPEEYDDSDQDDQVDQVNESMSDGIPPNPIPVSVEDPDDEEPTPRFTRQRRMVPAVNNHVSSMNKSGRDWYSMEITGEGTVSIWA